MTRFSARDNTRIAELAAALGNRIHESNQVITNALRLADGGDRYWAQRWCNPSALLSEVNGLRGEQTRLPLKTNAPRAPLNCKPEDFAADPDPIGDIERMEKTK